MLRVAVMVGFSTIMGATIENKSFSSDSGGGSKVVASTQKMGRSPFTGTARELLPELYTFPEGWRSQVEGLHTLLFLKVFVGSAFRN